MTGITPEQSKEISTYLRDVVWVHIKEKILKHPDNIPKDKQANILYDMEDIFKAEAATYGLTAMN